MILYETDYYLYTVLFIKNHAFLEEKFLVKEIERLPRPYTSAMTITLTLVLPPQGGGNKIAGMI